MKSRYYNTCKRHPFFFILSSILRTGALPPRFLFLFDPGYLLPLDHEPFINHLVHMVVPAEAFAEPAPLAQRFQKIGGRVRAVAQVYLGQDAARGAVGEDAVRTTRPAPGWPQPRRTPFRWASLGATRSAPVPGSGHPSALASSTAARSPGRRGRGCHPQYRGRLRRPW